MEEENVFENDETFIARVRREYVPSYALAIFSIVAVTIAIIEFCKAAF